MVRNKIEVCYCREYGDASLPPIRELISDTPDPEKRIILDYLSENKLFYCMGYYIDPMDGCRKSGPLYYEDDRYSWDSRLIRYVKTYNIPLPTEFRAHILRNHFARKMRHLKLRLLHGVRITHSPSPGVEYSVYADKDGKLLYSRPETHPHEVNSTISQRVVDSILHWELREIFCYDTEGCGTPTENGYYWKIEFYHKKGLCDVFEGWPGEPDWRLFDVAVSLSWIEHEAKVTLGSDQLKAFLKSS